MSDLETYSKLIAEAKAKLRLAESEAISDAAEEADRRKNTMTVRDKLILGLAQDICAEARDFSVNQMKPVARAIVDGRIVGVSYNAMPY